MRFKTILQKWKQNLKKSMTGFCRWMRRWKTLLHLIREAFALPKKLEVKERDIRHLQFQLAAVRADNTELRMRNRALPARIDSVLKRPDAKLRSELRFCVQISEDGASWEAVTEHCCLGGCDMGIYTFPAEREALLFASLLQAAGYHAPHNIACPACYAEYWKDCIG